MEQVLAEEGKAKAIAFEDIDKAPEEKKIGITIMTMKDRSLFFLVHTPIMHVVNDTELIVLFYC